MTDVNNAVRELVISGLGEIPEVGWIIEGLVAILWPESVEDIWAEIKDKVEALIGKKLADLEYQQVKEDLAGLRSVIRDYVQAINDSKPNPEFISEKYNFALGYFEVSQPHFMSEGYEVLLLPLLAQMANLHLALLRDGVNFGSSWGWTPKIIDDLKATLTGAIKTYSEWVKEWYKKGYDQVDEPQKNKKHLLTLQWAARNKYVRDMTLQAKDIAFYWPYFNPEKHKSGPLPRLTREIYSDPQGTADDNPINIDTSGKARISDIRIWGWDRIDAVQQAFDRNWGPRMGDQPYQGIGGSDSPPHGWNGSISSSNPVVEASGKSGDIINRMRLKFKDGNQTNECGGNYPGGSTFSWSFDGHILSQIYITGPSQYYRSAECVIFGFRYEDSY